LLLAGVPLDTINNMEANQLMQLFCDVLDEKELDNYKYQYSNHCSLFPNVKENTWPEFPFKGGNDTTRKRSINEVWASL